MDSKLLYFVSSFRKIAHKPIESFVIQRILSLLNNPNIAFKTQQFLPNLNNKVLTDLYFPQINFHVEIYEDFHNSANSKLHDQLRISEIQKAYHCDIEEIECFQNTSYSELCLRIDRVVDKIKLKFNNSIISWDPGKENKPEYYHQKGYIDYFDSTALFSSSDEICLIFDVKAPKKGFLRAGGTPLPIANTFLWWPNGDNKTWINIPKDPETFEIITERHADKEKNSIHLNNILAKRDEKRVTFFKSKKSTNSFYKFFGVYGLDVSESQKQETLTWKRIETRYYFNKA